MLGRDDTLDISAFPAVPVLAVFPLTALTTSIGSRRWTKHRYAVADHGGGARDWRVPPITREPIDFGFGDE